MNLVPTAQGATPAGSEVAIQVADAVLYEGYMLYPYRPSAIKNRQRWSFGILYPPQYAEVDAGTERCVLQSEILLESSGKAAIQIELRFLHLLARRVSEYVAQSPEAPSRSPHFHSVPSLLVGERRIESWDEGVKRSVNFELASLSVWRQLPFRFAASRRTELLRDPAGQLAGIVRRTHHEVTGTIAVSCQPIRSGLHKLTIRIANTTPLIRHLRDRDSALLRSLVSAHAIVAVQGGSFISLMDPPAELRDAAAGCRNEGNFPVLVGTPPERNIVLCSPIILYDYPQIAPESAHAFYDSTEMDEMLTLRVLTLTGEEKDEMRFADDHVRNLLECTEQSAREQLSRTHGAIRGLRPVSDEP